MQPTFSKLAIVGAAFVVIAGLTIVVRGQEALRQRTGVTQDWSHSHLVFSNPGTFAEAARNGSIVKWYRIMNDPRFQMQRLRQSAAATGGFSREMRTGGERAAALVAQQVNKATAPTPSEGLWSMDMGSSAKVGAGMYPAKWLLNSQDISCGEDVDPDFVVYNTGLAGSGTQAGIIAYDNLYSGCTFEIPRFPVVYWQYNTDGGTIVTSPVLSADGTQVAFVQSVSSVARLVLLKWSQNSSLVQLTASPQVVTAAAYRTCTAPCMTSMSFHDGNNDTGSSPFYDDTNDAIYVGDNAGYLHKFTNIFVAGTPAEITGGGASSGWPQQMSVNPLSHPVYDSISGNVFVGPSIRSGTGDGRFHRIPAGGGSNHIVSSAALAGDGSGFVDGPLVDAAAGKVYLFVNGDGSGHGAVYQLSTSFASGAAGTQMKLGQGVAGKAYIGAFDNIYMTSSAATPTGNLYVCGRASASQTPTLYQLPITSNVMGTPVLGPALASGTADCSPITEYFNTSYSTDWIFLSVEAHNETASPISCPSGTGCIMSFDVTSGSAITPGTTTSATLGAANGTSGIIVNSSVTDPAGASNVYFSTLGNQACTGNIRSIGQGTGGCAVQATQQGLD